MIHHGNANAAAGSRAVVPFHFDEISVSWAGQGIRDDEFCFGTEDGQLRFTTVDGVVTGGFAPKEEYPEAVNGVAFIGSVIAVSNRREVVSWNSVPGRRLAERAVSPFGAHGVIAAAGGYFVAPLGPIGLMKMGAVQDRQQRFVIIHAPQQSMNYYRVAELHSHGRSDVLACAVRIHGIAVTELLDERKESPIRSLTFPGFDVVDICSLGIGVNPLAIGALDKGGTLVLLRNALSDPAPVFTKFPRVTGIAYRVFCVQGNILILTSTGLYLLAGLARRFLEGEPVESTPTTIQPFPLEAVDANLCGQRWLLVVLPDQVLRFDLDLLVADSRVGESGHAEQSLSPALVHPSWESHYAAMDFTT